MMRSGSPAILLATLVIGSGLAFAPTLASAQDYGSLGTLGGYGAASRYAMPGGGETSPMIVPYGGTFEGFMPGRMGGGSSLSFRSRPAAPMGAARSAFRLSPLPGGMSSMSGGGGGPRAGGRAMSSFISPGAMGLGVGPGRGGMKRMSGAGSPGVMPPSIGYPFRQPPSLDGPPAPGMGMSM
jgi:hypothetical protein